MRRVLGVARREFAVYFNSPIAYIFIVLFLATMTFLFFDVGRFFRQGQATMRPFFDFLPMVFIPFIPAITMRLWSEERKSGTDELLLTLPMRPWELVLGKFLAAFALLLIALLSSFPLPLTVDSLGDLDWGPTFGGYLGALFLGSAGLALGLFISSLTKNQIIAFILTTSVLFALYMIGTGHVLVRLPSGIVPWVEYLSFGSHYEAAARGILDLRDILYYVLFVGFFLVLNATALVWRKWS